MKNSIEIFLCNSILFNSIIYFWKKFISGSNGARNIHYRSEYHFKNFIWFNSLPSDLIDEMNEKFDRKSAESTKLMKFGRQVESSALNAMVNISFRSSGSNGRNGQLAGACEAPCSTRVGGASFFKKLKINFEIRSMTRSREWQIGPSLRPIWAVGAHFRVGCGCWKLIGCFQFSKKFENNSADRPQMTEFFFSTHFVIGSRGPVRV